MIRELKDSMANLNYPIVWYKDIKPNKKKRYIFQVHNSDDTKVEKSTKNEWSDYFIFKGNFVEGIDIQRSVLLHIPISSFRNAWRDCLKRPLVINDGQYFSIIFRRETIKRLVFEEVVNGTYQYKVE